jgi:hypothetical protein
MIPICYPVFGIFCWLDFVVTTCRWDEPQENVVLLISDSKVGCLSSSIDTNYYMKPIPSSFIVEYTLESMCHVNP